MTSSPPTTDAHRIEGAWSIPATRRTVMEMLEDLDWPHARAVDVGTGTGPFVRVLGEYLEQRHGLDPKDHLSACDVDPSTFTYDAIACDGIGADGRLPYGDGTFDAVISVEVVEHVQDQFAFFRELVRIAKPGARVIVTTPNTLSVNSRLRTFFTGFPQLFDPLPLSTHDPKLLGGHIHPISPYYLAYDALRAGLTDLELVADRTKRSAAIWTVLLGPLLLLGRWRHAAWMRRKKPDVARENLALSRAVGGWRLLTGRTVVLRGTTPRG